MRKFILISCIIVVSLAANAQFVITLKSNKTPFSGDTVRTCRDTILFTSHALLNGDTINSTTRFSWDFGDGTMPNGIGLNKVKHVFQKGGEYFVRVICEKGTNTDYAIIPVQVAYQGDFRGTKSDVTTKGICDGDEITLTGVVSPQIWKLNFPLSVTESAAFEVNNVRTYQSTISHKWFAYGAKLTNIAMLDSVGLKIEHSNASDLQIKITCPNQTSVFLKNFGGNSISLGQPVMDETPTAGTGFSYYWTNSPANGTLGSASIALAGTYTSENPLTALLGCPLNGDWVMTVTDNKTTNNGFVFSWDLRFNKNLPIPKYTFSNTYFLQTSLWSGQGVSATGSGITTAIPKGKGNTGYKFIVFDNFGCSQDTTVKVLVEAVTFDVSPTNGDAPLDVTFKNTTSWAKQFDWDFAYNNQHSSLENPSFTYDEKGRYKIKLTATSAQGCKDFDTISIIVTVPPSMPEKNNAFTPNSDGINDIFYLIKADDNTFRTFEGKIYTRWGVKVCEWVNIDEAKKGWDGTIDNKGNVKVAPGVYFYIIHAFGKDEVTHDVKGSLHLYRDK